jgi:hypothetical protein
VAGDLTNTVAFRRRSTRWSLTACSLAFSVVGL